MKRIIVGLIISVFVFSLNAIDRKIALIDSLENTLFPVDEDGKTAFKNIQGRTLTVYESTAEYEKVGENMCAVKDDGKWGFINNKGVMVIPSIYESKYASLHFAEGLAVVHKDGKWGAIDKNGKVVVPFVWNINNSLGSPKIRFYEGLLLVKDKKQGFIDKSGKIVVSCIYDDGKHFSEGLAAVKKDGKWGFVDKTGVLKIPCIYKEVMSFSEGLAAVKKEDKWGFIDKTGELKIQYIYENVRQFSEGLAAVKKNKRWGYIDKNEKIIISFNYTDERLSFCKGFAVMENNGKYGVINKEGECVVPFNYASYEVSRSTDGLVYDLWRNKHHDVGIVKDGKLNIVNTDVSRDSECQSVYYKGYQWLYNELKKDVAENSQKENLLQEVVKKDNVSETAPEMAVSSEKKQPKQSSAKTKAEIDAMIPMGGEDNENTFALIFANENYYEDGVQNVDFAANDGEIFKEYCIKTLGMPQDNVHIRKNATLNQIRSEIAWVKNVADAYDGDAKFIIYYAGHGMPDEKTKDAYLLPSDGLVNDPQSGYGLARLYEELGALPAKQVLVFLDACFSGAQRSGDMLASARATVIKPRPLSPQGNMVVFSASYGDETAYPYKDKGHGLFTYFLLKKLNETKGDATLGDLYEYVKEKVDRYSIVKNNKRQTPTITMSEKMKLKWQQLKLK